MTYTTTSFRLGPEFTPNIIKNLILLTSILTIVCALMNPFFVYLMGIQGPMDWLSLSWWGMSNYLWWQPITCLFVQHTGYRGIDLFFLITLAFNMYILWVMGSDIYYRVGKRSFLWFYFSCGILVSFLTFLMMPVLGQYSIISGATPAILALLVVWSFMNPELELLLFFLIPVKAKWLTIGILGVILLITLSNLNAVSFFLSLLAGTIGYLYGLIAWGIHSPFPVLSPIEFRILRSAHYFFRLFQRKEKSKSKIVDMKGNSIDDEEKFIDAMLEKISKYGESSLTYQERKRMEKISQQKRKK